MLQLGEELQDLDIIALSMVHQGDLMRRRGRFTLAIQCLEAAEKYANTGNLYTQGILWQHLARAHAEYGHKTPFLLNIDKAQEAATQIQPDLDTTVNQFNLIDVIQERAEGHTLLWEPQVAMDLYKESERLKPFRPLRDQGVFIILKAQAHTYAEDIDQGIDYAIKGLELARSYSSRRHMTRIQRMYDKVAVTPMRQHNRIKDLKEALRHHLGAF